MLGFGGDVASAERASTLPWRRWESRGSESRIPRLGGRALHPLWPGCGGGLVAG